MLNAVAKILKFTSLKPFWPILFEHNREKKYHNFGINNKENTNKENVFEKCSNPADHKQGKKKCKF